MTLPDKTDKTGVMLPLPLGGAYDYRVPDGLGLAPGDFVAVPFGPLLGCQVEVAGYRIDLRHRADRRV